MHRSSLVAAFLAIAVLATAVAACFATPYCPLPASQRAGCTPLSHVSQGGQVAVRPDQLPPVPAPAIAPPVAATPAVAPARISAPAALPADTLHQAFLI